MKTNLFSLTAMLMAGIMVSCQQAEEPQVNEDKAEISTRTYGDKSPKMVVYVETNDTNPLNAGDYVLSDGTAFVDIVELFASNLQKRTVDGVIQPVLKLNDKLTRVLEPDPSAPTTTGYHKYVKPLQEKGIKVLLTVLGNWDGISVASMNDTQTTQFAQILAYVVDRYDLDGIGFDDEYSGTSVTVAGSYGSLINKLENLMPAGKLITVFQWGSYGSSQINYTQGSMIDYAYHGYFGASSYISSSSISGVTNDRWSPISINLGYNYSEGNLISIYENAMNAADGQYGAMMTFNIRRSSDVDPMPVFEMLADGAYGDIVEVASTPDNAGDRPQDWEFIPAEYYITIDDVNGN